MVEVTHEEKADAVVAHEVEEFVVFLFGQVGGRGGAVVIAGAEEAGVGIDHHVAVVVAVLQQFAQPLQLAAAMGGVATVEENKEVAGPADGLHGDGVGGGVEVLLEVLLAVEVDIVVADGDEAGVCGGSGVDEAVQLTEGASTAFVGKVAIDDGEEPLRVGSLGTKETLGAVGVAFEVDVGADVDGIVVGSVGKDDSGMVVVPFKPLGHTVFGVGATGEEHASHIETVAGGEREGYGKDEQVFVIHGEGD